MGSAEEPPAMREEIANLVHPVINHALRLKDILGRGETPDFDTEQAGLKGLLLGDLEARRLPDFGGDSVDSRASVSRIGDLSRRGTDSFLGIRYALVCWLDEIFILDSPWDRQWNEQKLETQLYGTNIRAEMFWEQAKRAEARPGSDALEVFFLCVMLGFRGEKREQPEELQTWVNNARTRIEKSQGQELSLPPEHQPPTFVPPRHGLERFQRMILLLTVFMVALIVVLPAVAEYFFLRKN